MNRSDTIVAAATSAGGALSIVRVSGPEAIATADSLFKPSKGRGLAHRKGFSIAYGEIMDGDESVDDVLVSVFRAPNSYTGEDMAEISCHGSPYITRRIIELLIRNGARAADAGEFTLRAFMAGKMDLSQAEAVADMISSLDRATHIMASTQMRGGYSAELAHLRGELLRLASLLELELDFSEEDIQFADRGELTELIEKTNAKLSALTDSFALGNVLKSGVGVIIAGSPNVGKSTLLNALLKEDRAMVSDIAGTTRDAIEESVTIDGVLYRFIDTAGIRASADVLEQMGIERTYRSMGKASVILYLFDAASGIGAEEIIQTASSLPLREGQKLCIVLNKCDGTRHVADDYRQPGKEPHDIGNSLQSGNEPPDMACADGRPDNKAHAAPDSGQPKNEPHGIVGYGGQPEKEARIAAYRIHPESTLRTAIDSEWPENELPYINDFGQRESLLRSAVDSERSANERCDPDNCRRLERELRISGYDVVSISAKYGDNIGALTDYLSSLVDSESVFRGDAIVSNTRHYEALLKSRESLDCVISGLKSGLSADLLAQDTRQALYWLGIITGEITTDEILSEIFSKFCIGK